jgi:hypothetical protein
MKNRGEDNVEITTKQENFLIFLKKLIEYQRSVLITHWYKYYLNRHWWLIAASRDFSFGMWCCFVTGVNH